jgi:hypothetical protein
LANAAERFEKSLDADALQSASTARASVWVGTCKRGGLGEVCACKRGGWRNAHPRRKAS